jgi:hypothetical protein
MHKIIDSFKTLSHLATQIAFLEEAHLTLEANKEYLDKIKFPGFYAKLPFSKTISGSLQNHLLIMACSFLDEYTNEFTSFKHPELKFRIESLKTITKPVLKRINKWSDLKKFRNNILAHNLRNGKKSIFSETLPTIQFNIPNSNSETILLSRLIVIITTCIANSFPDLVDEIDLSETILSRIKFNSTVVNIEYEIEQIWTEINSIKESINNNR